MPGKCVLHLRTFMSHPRPDNDVKLPNLRFFGGHEHLTLTFNFLSKYPHCSYQFYFWNADTLNLQGDLQ